MEDESVNLILKKLESISLRLQEQDKRLTILESQSKVTGVDISAVPQVVEKESQILDPDLAEEKEVVSVAPEKDEEWTGRMLGKVGIVAVLAGVAFFLQYTWGMMTEPIRVMLGILLGVVLVVFGNYLQKKYLRYGNLITGGGLAILYLTIYYSNIVAITSSGVALFLMTVVTILAGVLSIVGGTSTLAVVGIIGGFVSPFLVGGGVDQYLTLLTYVLFLDVAIAIIAIFKRWVELNYLGFASTAMIFLMVAAKATNISFAEKMFFLTLFFLIYLLSSTIHSIFRKEITEQGEIMLTVLNAFGYLGMGLLLINDSNFVETKGFFALGLAVLFALLSVFVKVINKTDKLLATFLPSLSIVFISLAIPLHFHGIAITSAWFAEALVLFLFYRETGQKNFSIFGVTVYSAAIFRVLILDNVINSNEVLPFIFNIRTFLFVVAVVVAYFIVYAFNKFKDGNTDAQKAVAIFLVVANFLTVCLLTLETKSYFNNQSSSSSTQGSVIRQTGSSVSDTNNYYENKRVIDNKQNTAVSVIWAIYASLLLAAGFVFKQRILRVLGIVLFLITAIMIFSIVWGMGSIYRIITSIVYGVLALIGSFAYAKYKDKLIDVV